jgi:hypothetical protein
VRGFGGLSGGGLARLAIAIGLVLGCNVAAHAGMDDVPLTRAIVVFGDSQAQGLAGGLQRVLLGNSRYRVLNRSHPGAALVHAENEWLAPVLGFVAKEKAEIAVVMFGANDRLDLRDDGAYVRFRSDGWRESYAKRTDRILSALSDAGIKIIWCGNPIARSAVYSADMSYINAIYSEETARFGATFLPLWSVIANDQGEYTAYGPDRDGVTERLRNDDGIHFTAAGYELIAERVINLLPSLQANGR